jgi:O-acetyl-ADP-ribose deacetylase (regulator of RNase III)
MIEYIPGDIWTSNADAIVVPCSLDGTMCWGVVRDARDRWPQLMFTRFREGCKSHELKIGRGAVYYLGKGSSPSYLIMFPTRESFTQESKLHYIAEGLAWLERLMTQVQFTSIAIPALGCGQGRLHWEDVEDLLLKAFGQTDRHVMFYLPMDERIVENLVEEVY